MKYNISIKLKNFIDKVAERNRNKKKHEEVILQFYHDFTLVCCLPQGYNISSYTGSLIGVNLPVVDA